MVKYLRTALFFLILGKRRSLAQMKVEISNLTHSMVKGIERSKIQESHSDALIEILSHPNVFGAEALSKWSEEVAHSMIPSLVEKRRTLLYNSRWDIARLSEAEYENLHSFVEYADNICGDLIGDKIKRVLVQAEKTVVTRQYQDFMYKRFLTEQFGSDEFAN